MVELIPLVSCCLLPTLSPLSLSLLGFGQFKVDILLLLLLVSPSLCVCLSWVKYSNIFLLFLASVCFTLLILAVVVWTLSGLLLVYVSPDWGCTFLTFFCLLLACVSPDWG